MLKSEQRGLERCYSKSWFTFV